MSATAISDTTDNSQSHGPPSIKINIKVSPNSKTLNAAIILSSSEDLDIYKPTSYQRLLVITIPAGSSEGSISTIYSGSSGSGGNNLYAKIYPYAGNTNSYHDYATNTNVMLGYGAPMPVIKAR